MPKQKDFKRRVRERMQKTGEAYTAARARLIEKRETLPKLPSTAELAELGGMSDEVVRAKTGKGWAEWVRALDALDATTLSHREIAERVHAFEIPGWWAQMVTVGYERIRGLRAKGQRRGGGYEVNKSVTVPVPLARLYRAFGARERKRWLGPVALTARKATPEKTMRWRWDDDTPVVVYFVAKGPAKSQVTIQHGDLASKARADEVRALWTERFAALKELLSPASNRR